MFGFKHKQFYDARTKLIGTLHLAGENLGKMSQETRSEMLREAQGTFWNDDRQGRAAAKINKYDPTL